MSSLSLAVAFSRAMLAIIALRGVRWAYVAFIVVSLAYFPMKMGFDLHPRACEVSFSASLGLFSLTNFPHIILFALFFVFSSAQTGANPSDRRVLAFSAIATLVMGALIEIGEGLTGAGNCRLRDLIPDTAGIVFGAAVLMLWRRITRATTLNPFVAIRMRRRPAPPPVSA